MPIFASELLAKASAAVKHGDLESAKRALEQALAIEPDNLDLLREAAHFYRAISRDSEKARRCARRARQIAGTIVSEMDEILEERETRRPQKKLASRRIGGIIGPY
jgi:tetratricopeptide (TPR) repeat protein